ncbi:hypothetical protein Lalb_Chr03g0042051 [Lupinus albus]|uniref:Uncharacterized protein n=1 Tax=Lupinus albus TaxID=3870 RepID=A0A6A4QVB8_LUPAL|nr:hypothetical protein Lalb_Chr03g0042051 [Lupinus albus]
MAMLNPFIIVQFAILMDIQIVVVTLGLDILLGGNIILDPTKHVVDLPLVMVETRDLLLHTVIPLLLLLLHLRILSHWLICLRLISSNYFLL